MITAKRMAELVEEQQALDVPVSERLAARGLDEEELTAIGSMLHNFGPPSAVFVAAVELGYLCALEQLNKTEEKARG